MTASLHCVSKKSSHLLTGCNLLLELLKQKVSALYVSSAVCVCQLLCTALLKHLRCTFLQIIRDTDDRWILISRDISRTGYGLSSGLRTKSLTVSKFSSVRAQIDDKSK